MATGRYLVKFSFDGHDFSGYARQPEGGTVEDEILEAIVKAGLTDGLEQAGFASASRVDRGVSAIAAAAAFDTDAPRDRILRSINAKAQNVLVHSIADVHRGFDPRREADSRWYRYHFREAGLPSGLHLPSMREAASMFRGEHDFTAFARIEGRNPRRVIKDISLERRSGALVLDVWGSSFLWNQVRRMASALQMVGVREMDADSIARALDDGAGGPFPPLPPDGLFLMDVIYDGIAFDLGRDLPRGKVVWLRDRRHKARCALRYHEYLEERVGC
jgi:tRNA pseudouridine38-40 synthase